MKQIISDLLDIHISRKSMNQGVRAEESGELENEQIRLDRFFPKFSD